MTAAEGRELAGRIETAVGARPSGGTGAVPMISHKVLGHPAMLFGLGVVSFIIGLKGTMMIDDAGRARS